MKHPKYRVSDILYMDKDAVKELFSFMWEVAKLFPFYDQIEDIELVGSYAFGTNRLGSDIDFNVALKDYNSQIPAKQWWYTPGNKEKINPKLMEFLNKYGLFIDLGVVDPNSIKYNVCASTKKFELYNRGREPLPVKKPGIIQTFPMFNDKPLSVVNILDFDPAKDEAPPVFQQHLRFEPYGYYFIAEDRAFPRTAKWSHDEWADEVPYWKEKYGDKFESYHLDGKDLIAD